MSNEENQVQLPLNLPADDNSTEGLLNFFRNKIGIWIEKIAPAQIVSYDRVANRAVVKILNNAITTDGQALERKNLINIPVLQYGGGGFFFNFPIKENTIGWICACDRNIDIFKQNYTQFTPSSLEKHQYKDGFFIPDTIKPFNFQLSAEDENAVVLISEDGLTKISLAQGQAVITAENITLNGTNVTINATNITENGTLTVNGATTINSDLTATGTCTFSNKEFLSHLHSNGNQGANTGGVV